MSEAKGKNGSMSFDGTIITINKSGGGLGTFLNQGVQGDHYIVAKHITAIEFRGAGKSGNGFMSFDFPGKNPPRGGAFDALADENAVIFTADQADAFKSLRDEILLYLAAIA